ncbi:MAG: VirB3 family type IV secretion system protein [Nitrosospira sp.]|nr:VirB3 family type IV secretion system protein [Nitrosospira sp.]
MELRRVPIRRIGNRHNLFLGGDRGGVMMLGVICAALIFSAQEWRAAIVGIVFWTVGLYLLRLAAKADPQMRLVYLRHLRYKAHYAPRATPFRENTRTQEWQYR